jgi:prepilin-type N-terminal cleavage/methylation domain-containing protein
LQGRFEGVSVKLRETNNGARGLAGQQRGFSMIEMCVVVAIILILSAMAVFSLKPALQDANCDSAMRQVIGQMRQAREYAITNRRYMQITFPTVAGFSQIVITQRNDLTAGAGAANPVLSTVPVHGPEQFYVFTTLPDTPDGCGTTFAIVFQCANGGPVAGMLFQSDGELVDGAAYQPINGTVFLGLAGQTSTARAITILGSTGRVRGWKISGTTWTQF